MVAQKRVAIYARVSHGRQGQDPETQLQGLRENAARRAFVVVGEYVDYASGTREDRPQYQALFSATRRRQLDVVLVWRYDRFAFNVRLGQCPERIPEPGRRFYFLSGAHRHHHAAGWSLL